MADYDPFAQIPRWVSPEERAKLAKEHAAAMRAKRDEAYRRLLEGLPPETPK